MQIKKFSCIQCGAPKINPYTSPYIVCDFCGAFTDIDFTVGLDAWNKDPKRTQKYAVEKVKFEQTLAQLLGKGDKENYQKIQYDYWDLYYKIYPEYLPPSINTDEKYKLYMEVCAKSSVEYAFDKIWAKKAGEQTLLQQGIQYFVKGGKTLIESKSFFKLSDFYIDHVKDSFKDFYENPDYAIMHELLPFDVHLKMKLSMFVQAWIPYLEEKDAQKLLEQTHFVTEYTEITKPAGKHQPCSFCKKDLFVPEGSYKVYCENCHKMNDVKKVFNCTSCGTGNAVPDNPAKQLIALVVVRQTG